MVIEKSSRDNLCPTKMKVTRMKIVPSLNLGLNCIDDLWLTLPSENSSNKGITLIIVDDIFKSVHNQLKLPNETENVKIFFLKITEEPTTLFIDNLLKKLKAQIGKPDLIIGIGGGSILDITKAISVLYNNTGQAEMYQGWDLPKKPGIKKIGVPTLSGTGAEASRTCVLTNYQSKKKLGINSNFSIFDELYLDHNLTKTVNKNQYFYSGMDTFIHCIESLGGNYRNSIADAMSNQALRICNDVFLSDAPQSEENREKLMAASFLGGSAIGGSLVGIVHPLSAGLSVVLGTPHCLANCIVMRQMEEFYPAEYKKFMIMIEKNSIEIPENLCASLDESQFSALYDASIVHEKPLTNALGKSFKQTLTPKKIRKIYERM